MKLGLSFRETMTGTFYALAAPTDERPMHFTIDVRVHNLGAFLKDKLGHVEGELTMDGFADEVPVKGTLGFRMLDQRRLPYDLTFEANDHETYRLRGQKDLNLLALEESMTVLPASVYDAGGGEIMRATLRFDVRSDLRKFLRSFRLSYGRARER